MSLISRIFSRSARRAAPRLYARAVDAARMPAFYRALGVEDTVEGRYEMIVLHITLLLWRLRSAGSEQAALSQAVFDIMAADLDRSMREMGVGDLSVGRHMKRLGEGFYGRAAVYEAALEGVGDRDALSRALLRNIYDDIDPGAGMLAALEGYVMRQAAHLAAQPIAPIAAGKIEFMVFEGSES